MGSKTKLTLLYDGACPICRREVKFLKEKDKRGYLSFVNIDSEDYSSDKYLGINYRKAMDRIHAIKLNGEIIKDVEVFREAYRLIGLGWIYYPTKLPVFKNIIDLIYISWAKSRLKLTNRKSLDELCLSKKK